MARKAKAPETTAAETTAAETTAAETTAAETTAVETGPVLAVPSDPGEMSEGVREATTQELSNGTTREDF